MIDKTQWSNIPWKFSQGSDVSLQANAHEICCVVPRSEINGQMNIFFITSEQFFFEYIYAFDILTSIVLKWCYVLTVSNC